MGSMGGSSVNGTGVSSNGNKGGGGGGGNGGGGGGNGSIGGNNNSVLVGGGSDGNSVTTVYIGRNRSHSRNRNRLNHTTNRDAMGGHQNHHMHSNAYDATIAEMTQHQQQVL